MIESKFRHRSPTSKVCLRTDDNVRRERRLLDEISPERFPAASDTSIRLDQLRRRTDLLLAGERAAVDELLVSCQGDLLEEKRARRSADAAVVDRERLLAMCGHDLRNLLNVLALNAEYSASQGEAKAKSLDNLQRTVCHMDKLISNMLDLARLRAGTFHVAFESRNAAEIVQEAVEIFRPLAVAKSVSLNATLPDPALPARIDPDRIFQVLSNLFSNAITVTPKGGQVCVSAAKINDVVQVAVRDSGRGMAETDLERIFNPYCQLDGSERRGSGLGLFISQSIVEAHGGRVWAESRLGAGSTFFFTVPGVSGVSLGKVSSAALDAVSH
jgi:signal transduction histidine kinase